MSTHNVNFSVKGIGDSLWCDSACSAKVFQVDLIRFFDYFEKGPNGERLPYEVQLFGPDTHWAQYTDSGIEAEVREKIASLVAAEYPGVDIGGIGWSEQGMQPAEGWSFDVAAANYP